MLQRLILCVLLCVAACSPATHQTRMDRLTSSVKIGQFFLNAAENDPHIGTYTTNDAIVRNLLGTIHHSGPFAIPLAIAHDMYTNRHPPKGEYTKAETVFERELTTNEKAFGPDHPNVALSLHNLGWL